MRVSWTQIIGLAFPILVTAGTAVFLRVTKLGTAMRSLANDREITAMLGVPVRRVEAAAWFGSGLVCGAAGLLLSNLVGLDIAGLTFLVIPALAAALIGQLRSLWVTLAAGIVIGVVYSFLNAFSSLADYRTHDAVRARDHRAALVRRAAQPTRGTDVMGAVRTAGGGEAASSLEARVRETLASPLRLLVIGGLLAFVLLGLPALLDTYWLQIMTSVAIYSIVTLGLGLLIGRVGMVSLCQFALLAVGAWVALRLDYATSIPFPLLLLIAGLVTGVIGTLIGLPALRLTGLYLALITLMAAGAIGVVLRSCPVPERRRRLLREHAGRWIVVAAAAAGDGDRRHGVLPLLRHRRRADVPGRPSGTCGARPAEPGPRSARASPPRLPPA